MNELKKNVKKSNGSKNEIMTNEPESDNAKRGILTNNGDILTDIEAEKLKIMKQQEEQRLAREEFMKVKQRILERERIQKEEQEKRIKALVDELNDMVGLSEVKEEIRSLVNLIKIRKLERRNEYARYGYVISYGIYRWTGNRKDNRCKACRKDIQGTWNIVRRENDRN